MILCALCLCSLCRFDFFSGFEGLLSRLLYCFHLLIHAHGFEPGHVCIGLFVHHLVPFLGALYENIILKLIMSI
jgi:hypothetical protein